MNITIEDAQYFILSQLKKCITEQSTNRLANRGYDLEIREVTQLFIRHMKQMSHYEVIDINEITDKSSAFVDAAWDLCQKGIFRPGKNKLDGGVNREEVGAGYTITPFGKDWLEKFDENNFLPPDPNRLSNVFNNFQSLFGKSYFQRAKEAVHCYQLGAYLACCVMCGAATESILLTAAFNIKDKSNVLKDYFSARGRSKIEALVFGKTEKYIKERYQKYTDLISYWRDESSHGHDSELANNEAYISLLTLLRFSEFMKDHWDNIVGAHIEDV